MIEGGVAEDPAKVPPVVAIPTTPAPAARSAAAASSSLDDGRKLGIIARI